jgi:hypothetical protein
MLVGCTNKSADNGNCQEIFFDEESALRSESLSYEFIPLETRPDNLTGIISKAEIVDNRIYLLDMTVAKTVQVYAINGQYISTVGARGNGPGEYVTPNNFRINEAAQTITIEDMVTNRLLIYDLNTYQHLSTGNVSFSFHAHMPLSDRNQAWYATNLKKSWDGRLSKPYTFIQQVTDSIFLLKADMKDVTEMETVNMYTDSVMQTFRNLLPRKPNTVYTAYYFEMTANEKNVILAYTYVNRLEFFRYDDKVSPSLIIGTDKDQSDNKNIDDCVVYYTQVLCDDKYVYGLYQGQKNGEIRNSYIEIYTFDGEPVMQIKLDRYIHSIALDRKKNLIYGYSPDNSFDAVYIYPFNPDEI